MHAPNIYICTYDICLITSGCNGIWQFPDHVYVAIERNALMVADRGSFSLFQRDESRGKNERKKASRGLQGITRNPYWCNPDAYHLVVVPKVARNSPMRIGPKGSHRDSHRCSIYVCMHVGNSTPFSSFLSVRSRTWPSVCSDEQNVPRINLLLRASEILSRSQCSRTRHCIEVKGFTDSFLSLFDLWLWVTFGNSHTQVFAHDLRSIGFDLSFSLRGGVHGGVWILVASSCRRGKVPLHRSSAVGAWTFVESLVARYSRARDSTARGSSNTQRVYGTEFLLLLRSLSGQCIFQKAGNTHGKEEEGGKKKERKCESLKNCAQWRRGVSDVKKKF